MRSAVTPPKPTLASIARAAGIGIGVAILLNVILYFVATGAGWLPAPTSMGTVITIVPVLMFSIVPSILGAVVYFAITRYISPMARANHIFAIVASIVLVVMAASPLGLAAPTVGTAMTLEIMHLAAGLPLIYTLTKMA
ncbi:MAG: DUF6069 family protein [Caldilineaceae bacterium]